MTRARRFVETPSPPALLLLFPANRRLIPERMIDHASVYRYDP